jgi:hypothetical protein
MKIAHKLLSIALINLTATAVFAHDGHGLAGTHWHATDVLGFVAAAVAVGVAVWLSRGGK